MDSPGTHLDGGRLGKNLAAKNGGTSYRRKEEEGQDRGEGLSRIISAQVCIVGGR